MRLRRCAAPKLGVLANMYLVKYNLLQGAVWMRKGMGTSSKNLAIVKSQSEVARPDNAASQSAHVVFRGGQKSG